MSVDDDVLCPPKNKSIPANDVNLHHTERSVYVIGAMRIGKKEVILELPTVEKPKILDFSISDYPGFKLFRRRLLEIRQL